MLDQDRLSRTIGWARCQVFVNGRFVHVDPSTGEVLSEHRHPAFKTDGSARYETLNAEDYSRPERLYDVTGQTDLDYRDGRWFKVDGWTGKPLQRAYTLREQAEAVRLRDAGMTWVEIGRRLDAPPRTVQSWVRRARKRDALQLTCEDAVA